MTSPALEQVQAAWDAVAPQFDELVTPRNMTHAEELLRRVQIGAGTKLLDVATGSGALSLPAARRGAEVTATDLSPAMIERLAARARAEGLSLVARVMDGQALEFPDATFDVAASLHGVSIFPDLRRGLSEMVRVTRPGGTVLVAGFGALPKAEPIAFFLGAITAVAPDTEGLPSAASPPPPFQLADPEVFRGRLAEAGLRRVSVETLAWDAPVESEAALWRSVKASNPIAARLAAGLTDQQRAEARRVLDGMLRERSGGAPGAVLRMEINLGVGRREPIGAA